MMLSLFPQLQFYQHADNHTNINNNNNSNDTCCCCCCCCACDCQSSFDEQSTTITTIITITSTTTTTTTSTITACVQRTNQALLTIIHTLSILVWSVIVYYRRNTQQLQQKQYNDHTTIINHHHRHTSITHHNSTNNRNSSNSRSSSRRSSSRFYQFILMIWMSMLLMLILMNHFSAGQWSVHAHHDQHGSAARKMKVHEQQKYSPLNYYMHIPSMLLLRSDTNVDRLEAYKGVLCPPALFAFHPVQANSRPVLTEYPTMDHPFPVLQNDDSGSSSDSDSGNNNNDNGDDNDDSEPSSKRKSSGSPSPSPSPSASPSTSISPLPSLLPLPSLSLSLSPSPYPYPSPEPESEPSVYASPSSSLSECPEPSNSDTPAPCSSGKLDEDEDEGEYDDDSTLLHQPVTNMNMMLTEFGDQTQPVQLLSSHPCFNQHSKPTLTALVNDQTYRVSYVAANAGTINYSLHVFDYGMKENGGLVQSNTYYPESTTGAPDLSAQGVPFSCPNCVEVISKRAQAYAIPSAVMNRDGTLLRRNNISNSSILFYLANAVDVPTSRRSIDLVMRSFEYSDKMITKADRVVVSSVDLGIKKSTHYANELKWSEMNTPFISISSSKHFEGQVDSQLNALIYSFSKYKYIKDISSNELDLQGISYQWYSLKKPSKLSAPVLVDPLGITGSVQFVHQSHVVFAYWRTSQESNFIDVVYTYCHYLNCSSTIQKNRVVLATMRQNVFRMANPPHITVVLNDTDVTRSKVVITHLRGAILYHVICDSIDCSSYYRKSAIVPNFPNNYDDNMRVEIIGAQFYHYNVWNRTTNIAMIATGVSHPLLGVTVYVTPISNHTAIKNQVFSECTYSAGDMCLAAQNMFHYSTDVCQSPDSVKRNVDLRIIAIVALGVVCVGLVVVIVIAVFLVRRLFLRRKGKSLAFVPSLIQTTNTSSTLGTNNRHFNCVPSQPKFAPPSLDDDLAAEQLTLDIELGAVSSRVENRIRNESNSATAPQEFQ